MTTPTPSPPLTTPDQVINTLRLQGYALLSPSSVATLINCDLAALDALVPSWDGLALDQYLKDGGQYRRRRHSSFVVVESDVTQVPHRAHWQPTEYNALHGGMKRLFEPMVPTTINQPVWSRLVRAVAEICSSIKGPQSWYVEAHQFRIDTAGGIGRPTPEGAHRDGVDFVAILFIGRSNVKGGETRVFEAAGPNGQRFTMTEPWTLLLLDDQRVIHETTPIQPTNHVGHRDTLVLTYRAHGFQDSAT